MSIASEITRINNNIANAYTQVNSKGGTLPATQNSNNLATAISSISVNTPVSAISIVNNSTVGTTNHIVTDIVWKDVRKIELWFKHLENKTNNMLFASYSNSGSIVAPWISATSSGSITNFQIISTEVIDGYTHQVMAFSSSNTGKIAIGCWTDANYSSINAFKRIKFYNSSNEVIHDLVASKIGNVLGFYDEITKSFYGINNFNGIVEGEYS